jgi:hypothetical protein
MPRDELLVEGHVKPKKYVVPDIATNVRRTEIDPHDHLTEVGNKMINALKELGYEEEGVRYFIGLSDDHSSALCVWGYRDEIEVVTDLVQHIQAYLKTLNIDAKLVIQSD